MCISCEVTVAWNAKLGLSVLISAPFLNQSLKAKGNEIKIESTDNDTRIRQSKSTTNITASGNVLVNFSDGKRKIRYSTSIQVPFIVKRQGCRGRVRV